MPELLSKAEYGISKTITSSLFLRQQVQHDTSVIDKLSIDTSVSNKIGFHTFWRRAYIFEFINKMRYKLLGKTGIRVSELCLGSRINKGVN